MASSDKFFEAKKRAAVFKHGILGRYPVIFAAKAGSLTDGKKVMFLDGYAGPGEYEDGAPGSPLLLLQQAAHLSEIRSVKGIFVEENRAHAARLRQVLAGAAQLQQDLSPEAASLEYEVRQGDVGKLLPELLKPSLASALFVFLDPFGSAIARDQMISILHRHGLRSRWPPTELLLHFSVTSVARYGGKLRGEAVPDDPDEAPMKLSRVDSFLGGDWWQEPFMRATDETSAGKAALVVAEEFARRLAKDTGYMHVAMPVMASPTAKIPKYVLVLFTRHLDGVWYFADVLGKAGADWARACHEFDLERVNQRSSAPMLEGFSEAHEFDPKQHDAAMDRICVPILKANIARIATDVGAFKIADWVHETYGTTLGMASTPQMRKAVKELCRAGVIRMDGDGKGKFWEVVIQRGRALQAG